MPRVHGVRATQAGGNTVGTRFLEPTPRADGHLHLDVPLTIERLLALGVNTYIYNAGRGGPEMDDLEEFAPAAAEAGLDIWLYFIPPTEISSENLTGKPFLTDYAHWARTAAELSRRHPNITGWAIDDFEFNTALFTPDYVAEIRAAADAVNPDLGFYLCTYWGSSNNTDFLATYGPYLDGLIYPYLDGPQQNTQNAGAVGRDLDAIKANTDPLGLDLILLLYTGRFLDGGREPTEHYVDEALRTGMEYLADGRIAGISVYGAQLDDAPTIASSNQAMYGTGRLSFITSTGRTETGSWAEASQLIEPDPGTPRYELSFWHRTTFAGKVGELGRRFKQILIDDELVWSQDLREFGWQWWAQATLSGGPTIDLTPYLSGKRSAKLAIRVYEAVGGRAYQTDVSFDHFEPVGFRLQNPGFEDDSGWQLSRSGGQPLVAIDHWVPDRPRRIFDTIAGHFHKQNDDSR